MRCLLACAFGSLLACSSPAPQELDGAATGTPAVHADAATAADAAPSAAAHTPPATKGLQYSGAIALFRPTKIVKAVVGDPDGGTPARTPGEWIELSAPIWPKVLTLYQGEGANYPAAAAGQTKLAHDSALTFDTLLTECQPKYPTIVLQMAGGPTLTSGQINNNYRQLEACAYKEYTAKPYWIPQLVNDVDICGNELGAGWRLPTEADILAFQDADLDFLQDTLLGASNGVGGFYFSLTVWARAKDGPIQSGSLAPGATPRMAPLRLQTGLTLKNHYEGGLALRCLRFTTVND